MSNLDAFDAGYSDTKLVINIEIIDIINIGKGLISDGILLKKYIYSGNISILNIELKNIRMFSI